MAYSTLEDLLLMIPETELAQLSAERGDLPDEEVVTAAIAQADGEIDSYLGARYRVPLSPVPPLVKALSVDLALYHLYSRRGAAPSLRQKKYETAMGILKEIASGTTALEGGGGEPPGTSREVASLSSAARVFKRDVLGEW